MACQFLHRHLVKVFIPGFCIVKGDVFHRDKGQTIVLPLRNIADRGGVLRLGVELALQNLHHFLGAGDGGGFSRECAVPVLTGQVGNRTLLPVVCVTVIKLVGDFLAGDRVAVALGIQRIIVPTVGLGGVALHGIAILIDHAGCALGRQNVVQGVMGIIAQRQIVVACAQDITLGVGVVIAGHHVAIHRDRDLLRLAGLQLVGLAVANDLHGGFFHGVLLFVVAVGGLHIQLHDRFTADAAGVFHRDSCSEHILIGVIAHAVQRLLKGCIGQTVAKGVGDLSGIIPAAAKGRTCRAGGTGSGIQDRILITGLVVLVANVDALRLRCRIGNMQRGIRDNTGVQHLVHVAPLGNVLALGVCSRGGQRVSCIGVGQVAGGIFLAGQQVGDTLKAALAGVADPQTGVHVVLVHPA